MYEKHVIRFDERMMIAITMSYKFIHAKAKHPAPFIHHNNGMALEISRILAYCLDVTKIVRDAFWYVRNAIINEYLYACIHYCYFCHYYDHYLKCITLENRKRAFRIFNWIPFSDDNNCFRISNHTHTHIYIYI